ncbi:carbamate kinase [Neisseria sp. Ec49-e6-T10]|uniref:carbamate kinase n=1 Tax=Neisseria sp. Ec49-e6-T10 TaxID=3140744 RepID=UPI003EBBE672
MSKKLAVIAVGGNALIPDDQHCSYQDQYNAILKNAESVADMIEAGWRVVLTHGNGPQVGFILRRSELASLEVPTEPLDCAVADTQGSIGYHFQNALNNVLKRRNIHKPIASIVTQTIVSKNDPAFSKPTKPIGAFMDEKTAKERQNTLGWNIMEDSGRGWRRTVASPQPIAIQELSTIRSLLDQDILVIACGGGGIPVAFDDQEELIGVEAVIDKDLASALLAKELKADLLLIPTGVEQVAINFGTPEQQWLDTLTVQDARHFSEKGEFGEGSMGPKINAVIDFVSEVPDAQGLITSPDVIKEALERKTGTWIVNN